MHRLLILAVLLSMSPLSYFPANPTVSGGSHEFQQACSLPDGYWDVYPNSAKAGSWVTIKGAGTQDNGGWYEGLTVHFNLYDSKDVKYSLGSAGVGCKDGYPWLEKNFLVPPSASTGTGWVESIHDGKSTCCMSLEILPSSSVPPPTTGRYITLSPKQGPPGQAVTGVGGGWSPGSQVLAYWDTGGGPQQQRW